jgi:taurine dioxygenase
MDLKKLSEYTGAEVSGVDLSQAIDDATFGRVYGTWLERLVLVFRNQVVDDGQLVAFSRRFGELDRAPVNEASNTKGGGYVVALPEVTVISNVIENGVPIGSLGDGEAEWHTDMSYNPIPPSASLLYSLEVPPVGGDTSFTNMYAAYDALSSDIKAAIEGKFAIHDATYTSAGGLRKGQQPQDDVRKSPGAHHPLVREHPITGRKALFLGRRRNGYILDMPVEESERLLDTLWAMATQSRFVYTHRWRVGDLVMWDNRCTMHQRQAFDPKSRRILHRTQVKGDAVRAAQATLHAAA